MIKKITISNVASYGSEPVVIDGLEKVNYFFGVNGSGKTTISRLINKNNKSMEWDENPLECFVYNSDFVESNYSGDFKGIFTLGKENIEINEEIERNLKEISEKESHIASLKENRDEKAKEVAKINTAFYDKCWEYKQSENDFDIIFNGYNKSKQKLSEALLSEYREDHTRADDKGALLNRYKIVFAQNIEKSSEFILPNHAELDLISNSPIFEKVIVGKEDLEIGKLWKKLQNCDWVSQGKLYIGEEKLCPFCQQKLSENFLNGISEYFDAKYSEEKSELTQLTTRYAALSNQCIEMYRTILSSDNLKLLSHEIGDKIIILESIFNKNAKLIKDKADCPSKKIHLSSHIPCILEIDNIISEANLKIGERNRFIDNIKDERNKLKRDIWNYIVSVPLKETISAYETTSNAQNKAILEIGKKISALENRLTFLYKRNSDLERTKTGVEKTIKSINNTLFHFGFDNFLLKKAAGENYTLVRPSGEAVRRSLSEGEKTFVLFLYFYNLIHGSLKRDETQKPRVIVIDDPVSSLDGNIMFIVSTLINKIREEVINSVGPAKQLFIFTHNVYFYHQITFKKGKCASYWVVRKNKNSVVEKHENNPIKTSYNLLWDEIKQFKNEQSNSSTICNVMRRILENYFKIIGQCDYEKICCNFEGERAVAFASLISVINAGSHNVFDEISFSGQNISTEIYMEVFKDLFDKLGHKAHYNMMMNEK